MKRPVAISLAPNMEKDDVLLSLKTLLTPVSWFNFRITEKLEDKFAEMFGRKYRAIAVNSGRSAQYLILKALNLGEKDEVAIQALTCVAVPNSVRWTKAKPIFIDVDKNFNLDPKDLSEKISENTKVIITQHSFGMAADVNSIIKIAKKENTFVIEDCAVSLGAKYKGRKVGTLGDISFFSFGRDKVISSVFGGMILCKDKKLYLKIKKERDKLGYPPVFWVVQQLLHPIAFALILPIYHLGIGKFGLGKILLFIMQKLRLLSKPYYKVEEVGEKPKFFPQKMPGALAALAINQLDKLERYNRHRKRIANEYFKLFAGVSDFTLPKKVPGSIWLRFPIFTSSARDIFDCAKKNRVLLGDWYKGVVVPVNNPYLVGYKEGSCPNAEKYAGDILNLPTYPTFPKEKVKTVYEVIKKCKKRLNSK